MRGDGIILFHERLQQTTGSESFSLGLWHSCVCPASRTYARRSLRLITKSFKIGYGRRAELEAQGVSTHAEPLLQSSCWVL